MVTASSPVNNGFLAIWHTLGLIDSTYTLRLTVTNIYGNQTSDSVTVGVLNILNVSDSPDPFSPNNDGIKDTLTISANITQFTDWTLNIKSSLSGIIVRSFTGAGTSIAQVWDGRNDSGAIVSDGEYIYEIEAIEPSSQVSISVNGTITLDTSFPIAVITTPVSNTTISGDIEIRGTASATNFSSYKIEYGMGESPISWVTIMTSYTPVDNGLLATWNTTDLPNGIYIIKLTVNDIAGNVSTEVVTLNLDNIKITNISASPQFINPQLGEASNINFSIDRQADVTIKIYQFNSLNYTKTLAATPVNSITYSAGSNSFVWDGKDDNENILPFTTYIYTIEAVDGESRRRIYDPVYSPVTLTITDPAITSSFDPRKNKVCQISYTLSASVWISLKIFAGNTEVRSLVNGEPRPAQNNTEFWDGRNNSGNIVGTTSYTVSATSAQILPENIIVIRNAGLQITSLKVEPYLIMLPFYNQITTINYSISKESKVTIKIYDPNGNYVCTLQEDTTLRPAGTYSIEWEGTYDNNNCVSIEGDYRVEVTLTDASDNIVTRNGNVVVYK